VNYNFSLATTVGHNAKSDDTPSTIAASVKGSQAGMFSWYYPEPLTFRLQISSRPMYMYNFFPTKVANGITFKFKLLSGNFGGPILGLTVEKKRIIQSHLLINIAQGPR
jgi:hypothetical protein